MSANSGYEDLGLNLQTEPGWARHDIDNPTTSGGLSLLAGLSILRRDLRAVLVSCLGLAILVSTVEQARAATPQSRVTSVQRGAGSEWAPLPLKDSPTTKDIGEAGLFDQTLLPVSATTSNDNQALLIALRTFAQRTVRDDSTASDCTSLHIS